MLYKSHFPTNFCGFQELEYIRSYLFGRMAVEINGLLLVSGGLGMIKKQSLRRAGTGGRLVRYGTHYRMRKLMHQKGRSS
jgi:hypothetical protein